MGCSVLLTGVCYSCKLHLRAERQAVDVDGGEEGFYIVFKLRHWCLLAHV